MLGQCRDVRVSSVETLAAAVVWYALGDVPGHVLAAPASALCGWKGVIRLSLSLSLSLLYVIRCCYFYALLGLVATSCVLLISPSWLQEMCTSLSLQCSNLHNATRPLHLRRYPLCHLVHPVPVVLNLIACMHACWAIPQNTLNHWGFRV